MFFAQRTSVSDPYLLNPDPDPAKNLNPDLSYFLTQSEKNIIFFHNDKTFFLIKGSQSKDRML